MFKTVMIIAAVALAIGWAIYGIYEHKMRQEEKKHPRQPSERLRKTRSEIADWAKKMAEFEPPKRKKTGQGNQQQDNKS